MRLLVARFGEMDQARWWNTRGALGRLGEMALRRGFSKTHVFGQARLVFAVAPHRCRNVCHPPIDAGLGSDRRRAAPPRRWPSRNPHERFMPCSTRSWPRRRRSFW
ncbi:MAG: BrxE family protein [Isosphaeraceae bacterium]